MNPNTKLSKEIVFDVPENTYTLQVVTPNRATVGFAGSINTFGPYFFFDINLNPVENVASQELVAASTAVQHQNITFDEGKAAMLMLDGQNTITGTANAKLPDGTIVSCAGMNIQLIPVTEYATVRMKEIYGETGEGFRSLSAGKNNNPEPVKEYVKLTKKTKCDIGGNFKFSNIANGSFYVAGSILSGYGPTAKGGNIARIITLSNGENKIIDLGY